MLNQKLYKSNSGYPIGLFSYDTYNDHSLGLRQARLLFIKYRRLYSILTKLSLKKFTDDTRPVTQLEISVRHHLYFILQERKNFECRVGTTVIGTVDSSTGPSRPCNSCLETR